MNTANTAKQLTDEQKQQLKSSFRQIIREEWNSLSLDGDTFSNVTQAAMSTLYTDEEVINFIATRRVEIGKLSSECDKLVLRKALNASEKVISGLQK